MQLGAPGTRLPSAGPPCSRAHGRAVPGLLLRGQAAPLAVLREGARRAGCPRWMPDCSFGQAPWWFACPTEALGAARGRCVLCSWCKDGDGGQQEKRGANGLDRNAGAGGSGPAAAAVEGFAAGLGSVLGSPQPLGQGLVCPGMRHRCCGPQGKAGSGKGVLGAPGTPPHQGSPYSPMLFSGRRAVACELLLPAQQRPRQPGHPASSGETSPDLG